MTRHAGQDIETIRRDTDRDLWLPAEAAVAYGLVDFALSPAAIPGGIVSSAGTEMTDPSGGR
ncbi:hypothetical protein BH23ACT5_BH23ACT5_11320 [soil metagenome]